MKCVRCPGDAAPARRSCPACLDKDAQRHRDRQDRRREEGRCLVCDSKAQRGARHCRTHLAYYRAWYAEHAEEIRDARKARREGGAC